MRETALLMVGAVMFGTAHDIPFGGDDKAFAARARDHRPDA